MLGHIRTGTLDKFKEAFDKALSEGEGFSVAAHNCTESFMSQFDEACSGTSTNLYAITYVGFNFVCLLSVLSVQRFLV